MQSYNIRFDEIQSLNSFMFPLIKKLLRPVPHTDSISLCVLCFRDLNFIYFSKRRLTKTSELSRHFELTIYTTAFLTAH